MNKEEKALREQIANDIKQDLKTVLENCTALGRSAYGRYIDNCVTMIQNKVRGGV